MFNRYKTRKSMKKITLMALACAMFMGSAAANAQEVTYVEDPAQGYTFNKFQDNWFVEGLGGAGVMMSTYDKHAKFGDRVGYKGNLVVGKWFSPLLGVRVGGEFNQMIGITNKRGMGYRPWNKTVGTADGMELKPSKFNNIGGFADVMFNATNWICGYKADRFYNAIFFAGVGYGASKLNDDCRVDDGQEGFFKTHNQEFLMPLGLVNRFRLCDAWSINLELRDLVVRNAFSNYGDNVNGDAKSQFGAANILSLTAGVTYRFKNRGFNAYEPIDKSLYDNRIASLERDLQSEKDQNAEYQKQLERYKKALDEETRAKNEALARAAKNNPVMANDDVTLSIFFPLGSAKISDKNQINIQYMADVIKASNSDKVYTITGYADKATGTESRNLALSQERAEAVCKALVAAGVDSKKVKVDYKGCSVQPFEKDYLNRVAIIK